MNTGEPDIPANTLVLSTFAPLNRAMIVDCLGPVKPGNTPRISTPNSCGSLPANTVLATPFIPGRRSSSGKRAAFALPSVAAVFTARPWAETVAE